MSQGNTQKNHLTTGEFLTPWENQHTDLATKIILPTGNRYMLTSFAVVNPEGPPLHSAAYYKATMRESAINVPLTN